MASLQTTIPLRPSLASGLRNALEVYGHITPPNEEEDSDCTRFIGRCLVEINEEQRRYNYRLQEIEQNNGDTPSSKNDKIEMIWEEIGDLKGKVENIEERVENIEERVEKIDDKIDEVDSKIDDVEACLTQSIDQLEKHMDGRLCDLSKEMEERFEDLEAKVDSLEVKVDSLEVKFDKVMFEQDVWASRQKNSLASRLYQPVQPVGMSYINPNGKPVLKVPTYPVRSVGYYWNMHERDNHYKLVDAHRFFELDFRHWALSDDEVSNNSYETDNLDGPLTTLEQAVSIYPDRAVMALFNELGLVYSRFQEQVEREQLRPTVLQKRSPKDTSSLSSSKSKRRVKRPSDGSTTEVCTELLGSPTASGSGSYSN